jgi:hypothetical protein
MSWVGILSWIIEVLLTNAAACLNYDLINYSGCHQGVSHVNLWFENYTTKFHLLHVLSQN